MLNGWLMRFLREQWVALSFCVICVAACLVYFDIDSRERLPRLIGLAIQLVGAFLVWHELEDRLRFFGMPPSVLSRHIRVFPPPPMIASLSALEGVAATFGTGSLSVQVTRALKGKPVEEQIALLREEMRAGDEALGQRIEAEATTRASQDAVEASSRAKAVAELHQRLRESATNGIAVPLLGVSCVVIGQILSAMSPEIAALLSAFLP